MTATIVNAAPMTIMQGTQDKSIRALVPEAEVLPTHLPKFFTYAQKGPLTPELVVGSSRSNLYGEDSFDVRKPWATHATVFMNAVNAKGNSCMIQRVRPADAAPPATVRLWLDVLETSIPDYERNSDGSVKLSSAGVPVALSTPVAGFRVKWVAERVLPSLQGDDTFGIATQQPGDQIDQTTSTQSVRYPWMDLAVPDFGSYGNNNGIRLWAPTSASSSPVDQRLLINQKVYPFRAAFVRRDSELTTPQIVQTTSAEQFVNFVFKPGVLDANTDAKLSAGDVLIQSYEDLESANLPPQYGPFGKMHLYDAQITALLKRFYAKELPFADAFSDFTGETDEHYRFNPLTGVSSQNVPYHTFQVVTGSANSVRLSETSTLYARGGSDGTMNEALFAALVAQEVREYANPNSILQDTARYPESILYDSGFPLETKYALCSFIAERKDTAVVLSTHDVLGPKLSASEDSALAVALRTRAQMYPESEFFGTPTMRAVIIGRSGDVIGNQYTKPLPLTLEIATKAAGYMGAGNGKWRSGLSFDMAPASEVTMFRNVNVTFTPATVRNKDWANGLNWVESYGRRSLYFPAIKTVYDNDTSVLNSFFTMMACVELQKIGERARRRFSGVSSLTNAQFIERINEYVVKAAEGKFDGRFVIRPKAYFTQADRARGYSYTLPIEIYAPGMLTVGTLSIEAYRMSDLETA